MCAIHACDIHLDVLWYPFTHRNISDMHGVVNWSSPMHPLFQKKKKSISYIYILYPLSFLLSLTSYMHEDVHIWKKMINTSILQLLFVQSKLIFWCYFHMANLIVSLVYFFLFILTMKLLKLDCIRSNNSWSGRSIKLQFKIREKHNFIWVLLWSRWKRFKILQYAWTTTMNQHIAILDIH